MVHRFPCNVHSHKVPPSLVAEQCRAAERAGSVVEIEEARGTAVGKPRSEGKEGIIGAAWWWPTPGCHRRGYHYWECQPFNRQLFISTLRPTKLERNVNRLQLGTLRSVTNLRERGHLLGSHSSGSLLSVHFLWSAKAHYLPTQRLQHVAKTVNTTNTDLWIRNPHLSTEKGVPRFAPRGFTVKPWGDSRSLPLRWSQLTEIHELAES